jgi:hypothetical protein
LPFNTSEDWKIEINLADNVGNTYQTVADVKIDNNKPFLSVEPILNQVSNPNPLPIDPTVSETVTMNISVADTDETGIDISTLVFELVEDTGSQLIIRDTIPGNDSRVKLADDSAEITLDISELAEGDYFIRTSVYDKTSNLQQTRTRTITIHITVGETTTSPENTTSSEPPTGGGGFGTVNLIEFIVFNLLALGGGIGIAALYERYKTMKA